MMNDTEMMPWLPDDDIAPHATPSGSEGRPVEGSTGQQTNGKGAPLQGSGSTTRRKTGGSHKTSDAKKRKG